MLLSGGIDSSACAFLAKDRYTTSAITFAFHGIAEGEVRAAQSIGERAGLKEHRVVRLPDLKEAADLGASFGGLPKTYIPMRNAVFYSLAASYAEEIGAEYLVGGHNKDDVRVFRDTESDFFERLEGTLRAGSKILDEKRIRILRPLGSKTKPQVVRLASDLGVPFELTWSCHSGGNEHCWECPGCEGRIQAFEKAGVVDPLRAPR